MKRIKPLPTEATKAFTSKIKNKQSSNISKEKRDAFETKVPKIASRETSGAGEIEKYKKAACRAVGVPYELDDKKIYHHVGDFQITSSVEAVDALVQVYWEERSPRNIIYSYEEYLDALKRRVQMQRKVDASERHQVSERERYYTYKEKYEDWDSQIEKRGAAPTYSINLGPDGPSSAELQFLNVHDLRVFKPNLSGFLGYIDKLAPDLSAILKQPLPLYLEEDPNRPHGYVLGTPGSGKSELLKLLIHTYVTNEKYGSVVVIDPTSDFAGQIAHWKEFNTNNKLIYIRPTLAKGMTPVINPFEIYGVKATDYSEEAINIKSVIAQELVEALSYIISGTITPPMENLLTNCVLALLDKDGATIEDLLRFVQKDNCEELVSFACGLDHYPFLQDYFSAKDSGFANRANQNTKDAVERRVGGLLNRGFFGKLTCGKSTFQLEEAVNQKKVIVFDLGKGAIGAKEGAAFGRLITAMLLGMANRRANVPMEDRVPCSLVVDECQNFVSESLADILAEARKFRLFATLAQQIAGQRMPIELKDSVLQNTNMQVVGGTTPSGAKRNAELAGVTPEEVTQLEIGEFYTRPKRSLPAVKFKARGALLGWKNSVTKPTWKRTVLEQVEKYYQHHDGGAELIIEEDPDISSKKWERPKK